MSSTDDVEQSFRILRDAASLKLYADGYEADDVIASFPHPSGCGFVEAPVVGVDVQPPGDPFRILRDAASLKPEKLYDVCDVELSFPHPSGCGFVEATTNEYGPTCFPELSASFGMRLR